jgi:hypothetical protein
LESYAAEEGEILTREEELELARELAEAAQALAGSDPDLAEQLSQAADAIERGDIGEARQEIREAAQGMAEAGERVQRQEAVESTLAELQEGREQIAEAGCGRAPRPRQRPAAPAQSPRGRGHRRALR